LQEYFNAVLFAGGTPNIAVRYLPLSLTGTERQWLNDLLKKSIQNWFDTQIAFTKNFKGTYKRPHTAEDLLRCTQEKDEISRNILARWLDMKNSCEGINAETAILAFIGGLERGSFLRHTLLREQDKQKLTINGMISIASSFGAADDDARDSLMATTLPNKFKKNNHKRKNPPDEKQSSDIVAMTFAGTCQGG
jgi:hypothetical protein